MAARHVPFARWSRKQGGALAAIVAAIFALAAGGQGLAALTLLASIGVASGILLLTGYLKPYSAEDQIKENAPRIFGALPVPVAVSKKNGKLIWASEAFISAIESIGNVQDLSTLGGKHPDVAAPMFRLFAAARQGSAHTEEISLPRRESGGTILLTAWPLVDCGQSSPLIVWRIEERAAIETQAGYKPLAAQSGVLDVIPAPALLVSKELTIEGVNSSFAQVFGYSPGGPPKGPVWKLLRGPHGSLLGKARLRDLLANAQPSVPVQIIAEDGSLMQASLYVPEPSEEKPAETGAQLWIFTPAPIAAEHVETAFKTLLGRSPMALALMAPDGTLKVTNRAFRYLFADPSAASRVQEPIGKPLFSLVTSESSPPLQRHLAAISANPLSASSLPGLNATLKGPAAKHVHFSFGPAADGVHIIVFALDGPSGAPRDEQSEQSQKLQAVGELAGGIAHDFNNLLTAIIGFSDLLLRRFRASDPAFKDLMNIKNNATRAAELVKQILAYSRRQTLRSAILRITDIIEEFQATIGRTLGEKVKAKIEHGRDLWFVKADEGQLFQVVMNLAVNARDAMPDGGEITIRTANVSERESLRLKDRGLERGEYVMCEVRDTGTGIKPEHLNRIFDPFFSTKEVGKGTGLGLSTVYGIVKQTGGTILVDSAIGVGSTFRIYIPRYVETENDLKALESKAQPPEQTADLTGSGKVLLVEDEEAVRSFASRALSTRGYTVLEASSGVEALEVMDREKGQIDLVVSDVVMPEMDGPTLLRHLRERNPDIKIVFMSGYAEEAFRKNLGEGENFIFLPKPFTLKKLAETIKAAAA
jgi:two-component system cell cycle sensor histidine kinase/response regulator CckA